MMKKILIFILSLVMTVSLAACGNGGGDQQGNGGESTPEKKDPISMSAEEIYDVVENLYETNVIDLNTTHTKYLGELSSTNEITLACKGFFSGGFEYYLKNKIGINDFTDEIYVGGIHYTNYGGEIKIKTEKDDYQAREGFIRSLRAYPEMSDFAKSEVTSDSEKATLTLTGISAGCFYEVILGIEMHKFDSVTEYENACSAYSFDPAKYVLAITVNAKGELIEITEDYSYDYSKNGKTSDSYVIKTKTVLGNNIEKIVVPEDADSYTEY